MKKEKSDSIVNRSNVNSLGVFLSTCEHQTLICGSKEEGGFLLTFLNFPSFVRNLSVSRCNSVLRFGSNVRFCVYNTDLYKHFQTRFTPYQTRTGCRALIFGQCM